MIQMIQMSQISQMNPNEPCLGGFDQLGLDFFRFIKKAPSQKPGIVLAKGSVDPQLFSLLCAGLGHPVIVLHT
jgi:hypothetical protein